MRKIFLSAALLSGVAAMAGCNSATPADYARMDAYNLLNAPGARGAPTPKEMAAMGYFRMDNPRAAGGGETSVADAGSGNPLANLRFIGR